MNLVLSFLTQLVDNFMDIRIKLGEKDIVDQANNLIRFAQDSLIPDNRYPLSTKETIKRER